MLSYYPEPNRPGLANNFFSLAGSNASTNNFSAKIDRLVSDRQHSAVGVFAVTSSPRRSQIIKLICLLTRDYQATAQRKLAPAYFLSLALIACSGRVSRHSRSQ
jgi:hypothetical protein